MIGHIILLVNNRMFPFLLDQIPNPLKYFLLFKFPSCITPTFNAAERLLLPNAIVTVLFCFRFIGLGPLVPPPLSGRLPRRSRAVASLMPGCDVTDAKP